MLDDSTGPQQYHLQIYPIVITDNITVYLFKFSQYRNITKRLGTGFNHPPPPPPLRHCTNGGARVYMYVQGFIFMG